MHSVALLSAAQLSAGRDQNLEPGTLLASLRHSGHSVNSSALITCGTRNAQPTRAGRLPMGSGPPHCVFSFFSLVAFSRWRQDPLWLTIPIPHLASMRSGTTGEIRVPLSGRLACSPPTLMLGDRPDQTLIGSHSAARKMRHASTPSRRSPSGPRVPGVLGPSFSAAILCVRRAERRCWRMFSPTAGLLAR